MLKISSHKIFLEKGNVQGLSTRYEYTFPYQNMSNQLDSLKDTNSHLIDYVKSINTKVGTANSGKEFSEITENNKSRKIKEFKSKAETALLFAESYALVSQY